MNSYYPPGYNGMDDQSSAVVLRCCNGHYWQTTAHYELGSVTIDDEDCYKCNEIGELTDMDYVPEDDEEEDDEDDG